MKILGIIPARFASTRFPAKALADINGKPMVQRVYEQCLKASSLNEVIVATDNEQISAVVSRFGKVVMTSEHHLSGTDRCAEVIESLNEKYDFVINIQGDEPYIKPQQIDLLSSILSDETELATLVKEIQDYETLFNPNTPKVLLNNKSEAIYFCRNTIPYLRNFKQQEWLNHHTFFKHIGIYAYRTDILKIITGLKPGILEQAESLEQLRWIENGYKIKVGITEFESFGIDTPDDLEKVKKNLE